MPQVVGPDICHMPLVLPCIWHASIQPQWTVVWKMLGKTSQVLWDLPSIPQVVGPDICHTPLVLPYIWRENTPPQWTVVRRMSRRTSQVVCMACRQSEKSYP